MFLVALVLVKPIQTTLYTRCVLFFSVGNAICLLLEGCYLLVSNSWPGSLGAHSLLMDPIKFMDWPTTTNKDAEVLQQKRRDKLLNNILSFSPTSSLVTGPVNSGKTCMHYMIWGRNLPPAIMPLNMHHMLFLILSVFWGVLITFKAAMGKLGTFWKRQSAVENTCQSSHLQNWMICSNTSFPWLDHMVREEYPDTHFVYRWSQWFGDEKP